MLSAIVAVSVLGGSRTKFSVMLPRFVQLVFNARPSLSSFFGMFGGGEGSGFAGHCFPAVCGRVNCACFVARDLVILLRGVRAGQGM